MTGAGDREVAPTITLRGHRGRTAVIRRDPDGIYRAQILDESAREEAGAIAAFLNRPRPPRPRPSC